MDLQVRGCVVPRAPRRRPRSQVPRFPCIQQRQVSRTVRRCIPSPAMDSSASSLASAPSFISLPPRPPLLRIDCLLPPAAPSPPPLPCARPRRRRQVPALPQASSAAASSSSPGPSPRRRFVGETTPRPSSSSDLAPSQELAARSGPPCFAKSLAAPLLCFVRAEELEPLARVVDPSPCCLGLSSRSAPRPRSAGPPLCFSFGLLAQFAGADDTSAGDATELK